MIHCEYLFISEEMPLIHGFLLALCVLQAASIKNRCAFLTPLRRAGGFSEVLAPATLRHLLRDLGHVSCKVIRDILL